MELFWQLNQDDSTMIEDENGNFKGYMVLEEDAATVVNLINVLVQKIRNDESQE